MARVKGGVVSRKRRKRILKLAKGYYGAKHILFRTAKEQVMNSYYYAYRDRRQKKRDFRKLWITRINAAARMNGLSYSQLMHGLFPPIFLDNCYKISYLRPVSIALIRLKSPACTIDALRR